MSRLLQRNSPDLPKPPPIDLNSFGLIIRRGLPEPIREAAVTRARQPRAKHILPGPGAFIPNHGIPSQSAGRSPSWERGPLARL